MLGKSFCHCTRLVLRFAQQNHFYITFVTKSFKEKAYQQWAENDLTIENDAHDSTARKPRL